MFNHLAGHIYAHHIIQAQILGIYMQGFTAKFATGGGFRNIGIGRGGGGARKSVRTPLSNIVERKERIMNLLSNKNRT